MHHKACSSLAHFLYLFWFIFFSLRPLHCTLLLQNITLCFLIQSLWFGVLFSFFFFNTLSLFTLSLFTDFPGVFSSRWSYYCLMYIYYYFSVTRVWFVDSIKLKTEFYKRFMHDLLSTSRKTCVSIAYTCINKSFCCRVLFHLQRYKVKYKRPVTPIIFYPCSSYFFYQALWGYLDIS